jgi:hypothetical protein
MRRKADSERSLDAIRTYSGERTYRLYNRLVRAMQRGKGITLSPAEFDEFIALGGYDLISAAVAKQMKDEAVKRIEEREGQPPNA